MHMSLQQHVDLLMDWNRGLRLKELIQEAVRPGMRVLDAGSGSGILALWAAQQGASIIAVDRVEYPVAVSMANCNGLEDRIRFVQADLAELDAEAIGGRVDVLLAMVYWNDPRRDEQQSRVVRGLVERCLTPRGRPIPDGVEYSVAAYDWSAQEYARHQANAQAQQNELENRYGLDFTPFFNDPLCHPNAAWFPKRLPDKTLGRNGVEQLTETASFKVDYSSPVAYPPSVTLPVVRPGRATAVIWAQRLLSGERTVFFNESLSWISPAREIAAGSSLELGLTESWRRTNVFAAG